MLPKFFLSQGPYTGKVHSKEINFQLNCLITCIIFNNEKLKFNQMSLKDFVNTL